MTCCSVAFRYLVSILLLVVAFAACFMCFIVTWCSCSHLLNFNTDFSFRLPCSPSPLFFFFFLFFFHHVLSLPYCRECGHFICNACAGPYGQSIVEKGAITVECPNPECKTAVSNRDLKKILTPRLLNLLEKMTVERAVAGLATSANSPAGGAGGVGGAGGGGGSRFGARGALVEEVVRCPRPNCDFFAMYAKGSGRAFMRCPKV